MQFFGNNLKAVYQTKYMEINGHSIIIWDSKNDAKPALVFDIKEVLLYQAVKGLPGNTMSIQDPMICLLSRYHKNLITGDITGSTWFFEFTNDKDKKDCIFTYYVKEF